MAKVKKIIKQKKRSQESVISMILGALIVIVVGIIVFNYFSRLNKKTNVTVKNSQPTINPEITKIQISPTEIPTIILKPTNTIAPTKTIEQPKPTTAPIITTKGLPSKYTVKEGDDLWTISERYYQSGYNWVDIAKENKLKNPNIIESGTILTIPKVASKTGTITQRAISTIGPTAITSPSYKVIRGDYLWEIAVRACGDGYKWVKIAEDNRLTNPNIIHAGNILRIKCK